ncbi:ribonuclease E/G [Reyranella sp.]|uniref:ribonuclease E/G n=1 Tax=Reyranella sp. TaxID=1929291 RepID=UPI0012186FF5|nr:Rne/Rng family ribonuclease [Reyranella sp.]TAJ84935.1 MAG: Rne/Rng family ribonuclease [Reyranella sp.]
MARRMLIDASHPEETRVVVVDGTRLEEFDFETSTRKPLKGNIYLAKVIRIEPSLQAAFVEYGGNRHGFLAFSEIHPDYYQIPVADRERLIAEQQRLHAEAEDEEPRRRNRIDRTDIEEVREDNREAAAAAEGEQAAPAEAVAEAPAAEAAPAEPASEQPAAETAPVETAATEPAPVEPVAVEAAAVEPAPVELTPIESAPASEPEPQAQAAEIPVERIDGPVHHEAAETPAAVAETVIEAEAVVVSENGEPSSEPTHAETSTDPSEAPQPDVTVETLGGDEVVEERETRERRRRNPIRQYKIQEVIKRRQILLVQVVKEERGNKGAALTTYLSLAGRYCVLMPNAGRGGGISRKISNPADRKRMKEILAELDVPQGMGVILRTAGLERSTIDIKRDYEYLSRLWDSIRELTMRSTAPALIYEEGDLIKRSLRDVYDTDIAQVLVEGEAGFQAASEFMRQLVPHQANKVELYKEPIPLFHRYQVENQFDAMHSPTVQLRSGGYIVINPTEALVAIDVNSGRSTKERNIEETAVRTNIEAAEEIARQVRLRDLAGLIVIDFIDMEETRHQRQVEHKVKDAMRNDRARIQIGRISAFGLLEMSRQRLRPSLLEHSTEICPHCAGTGRVRSIESAALHALRAIEEEGVRRRASEILVSLPPNVALYLLNQKRHTISEIENRYNFHVTIEADDELHAADCEIERVRSRREDRSDRPAQELARATYEETSGEAAPADHEDETESRGDSEDRGEERSADDENGRGRGRRRRRRRRGRRDGEGEESDRPRVAGEEGASDEPRDDASRESDADESDAPEGDADRGDSERGDTERADGEQAEGARNGDATDDERGGDRRRRRGRRGGRRRRRENGEAEPGDFPQHEQSANGEDAPATDAPATQEGPASEFPPATTAHEPAHVDAAPMELAPFDPGPPVNVEAAEPPPPPPPPPPPAPEPVAVTPVMVAAPQPEPEPTPAPPPVPVIDAPPEKPKRGWWRR